MRIEWETDTEGRKHPVLVAENERERRELALRKNLAVGGIGPQHDGPDSVEPDGEWSDD